MGRSVSTWQEATAIFLPGGASVWKRPWLEEAQVLQLPWSTWTTSSLLLLGLRTCCALNYLLKINPSIKPRGMSLYVFNRREEGEQLRPWLFQHRTSRTSCRVWSNSLKMTPSDVARATGKTGGSLKHSTGNSWGFSGDSDSKESTCNVGNLGFIPGLGRSPEEGMATYSSILVWSIPMDWGAWQVAVHWVTEGWTRLSKHTLTHLKCLFLAHIKPETHFPDYIIVFF